MNLVSFHNDAAVDRRNTANDHPVAKAFGGERIVPCGKPVPYKHFFQGHRDDGQLYTNSRPYESEKKNVINIF